MTNSRQDQILEEIRNGRRSFQANSNSADDLSRFQVTVNDLRALEADGHIEITNEHPESHSGFRYIDHVTVRLR